VLLCAGKPAHAWGTWSFSVTGTGSTNPVTTAWSPPAAATGSISIPQYSDNIQSFCMPGQTATAAASMSISATMTITWVPDPNLPNEPVPDTVNVVEQSEAKGNGDSEAADDGLGDAAVNGDSKGTHVMQLALNNGTASWNRSFSASGSQTITNPPQPTYARAGAYLMSYTAATIAPTINGHSTVDTADWDAVHPSFFSGTNCTASASASAVTGYVTDMQLLVGGNLVEEYLDTPDHPQNPHQSSVALKVVFDSTHFGDAAVEPIKAVVTDSGGNTYSGQITGKIYNKAYILGNPSYQGWLTCVQDIAPLFPGTISKTTVTTAQDGGKQTILGNLPTYTILYAGSHGSVNTDIYLGDLTTTFDGAWTPDVTLSTTDVSNAVAGKNGQPAYDFAQFDACYDGAGNAMGSALGLDNGFADQAYVSWDSVLNIDDTLATWDQKLWEDLAAGWTLSAARFDADKIGSPNSYDIATKTVIAHGAVYSAYGDSNNAIVMGAAYGAGPGVWYRVITP